MRHIRRIAVLAALGLAASVGCRVGYDRHATRKDDSALGGSAGIAGGGAGRSGEAGAESGGTGASGGTAGAASTGGSSTGATAGGGGESSGGAAGAPSGGTSGASVSGGTSGSGGSATSGAGGAGGAGGCSPTNGGIEICDGVDNDCTNGADDGVTCPATCRGIPYDGNGYMFCDAEPSATDADASCTMLGMHLVKVDSAEENDFIASNMFGGTNQNFIWLGGDDIATEGSWTWRDGTLFWTGTSSGSAPSGVYTNWYTGYPGGNNADCLEMRDDGTWDDKQCSQGKRYVCELSY